MSSSSSETQSLSIISMPNIATIKLSQDNYLLWKAQMIPYFRGQDLFGYLDGTTPPPPKNISITLSDTNNVSEKPNPAYSQWIKQDNLILSTLMSSLTEGVLAQVVNYSSSHDVWCALEETFFSKSRARSIQIRTQLATATKGSKSATEYFHFIKRLADELAIAGQPLTRDDIISYIFTGLGHEYESFVASISARTDSVTLEEIHSLLLSTKARLSRHQLTPAIQQPSANVAQRQSQTFVRNGRGGPRGRGRGNHGGFNFSNRNNDQPSIVCQVCDKVGHSARKCYHRFDPFYQVSPKDTPKQAMVAMNNGNPTNWETEWHADTSATHHLTNDVSNLNQQSHEYNGLDTVQVGNGKGLHISKTGSSKFKTNSSTFVLNQVLVVPEIQKNLISVQQFCIDNNVYFEFHAHFFLVKDYLGKVLHKGHINDGLYSFATSTRLPQTHSSIRVSFRNWHRRLGHASSPVVHKVLSTFNFPVEKNKLHTVCPDCQMAKSHNLPFKLSTFVSSKPLDLIFTDVWGPAYVTSTNGAKYYVSFQDDFSKFTWLFPIKLKSDVEKVFLNFQQYVEKQFERKIKAVQSDWGGEYRRLNTYFKNTGINHRLSCPHTHQQNGSIERKHRHIVEVGLSMLAHSNLPMIYWDDAFQTATYVINRLPTTVLNQKSPFEKLYNRIPDYSFMRVFGCACWPNLRPYNKNKLNFRSKTCIFIGYSLCHQGYKCLDLSTGKVYVSRHVVFDENLFPYTSENKSQSPNSQTSNSIMLPLHINSSSPESLRDLHPNPIPTRIESAPLCSNFAGTDHGTSNQQATNGIEPESLRDLHPNPIPSRIESAPLCSNFAGTDHGTLNQQATNGIDSADTPHEDEQHIPITNHSMITRAKNHIHKPRQRTDGCIRYPLPRALIAETTNLAKEPTSFTEACKSTHWRDAMNNEFNALLQNGTWSLVSPSTNTNVVGCRWVFKIKRKVDGTIERYKARLVAKGFHQQEGVDFYETFSPVIKHTTIRLVISLAVSFNWPIRLLDVQNAFLHGELQEDVFMSQPPGYIHPQYPNHVCKLHKSLYGLRQAPRAWFSKLSDKLKSLGFQESKADTSLFIFRKSAIIIFILIYVDDILITGSSSDTITRMIDCLKTTFAIKDLGSLNFFLGVEALRCPDGIYLTQRNYIVDLLKRSNMDKAKPCTSPMASNCHLTSTDGHPFEDMSLYRSIVGSLQYLSFTRPDLAFAVHKVSKFMHQPLDTHWVAVKRILRYLKHSISTGLYITKSVDMRLQAYSDSDWATDRDNRRSVGAFCVYMGSNLISWSCKQQLTVARSSTEAEYKALANTAAELTWIKSLLIEIGFPQTQPPVLWCDNIGATYLTSNPAFHARTKHIEIDFQFVRDQVFNKQLVVQFISSRDQLADALTKPLPPVQFKHVKHNLNVRELPSRLRGHVENQVRIIEDIEDQDIEAS
ncbi:hypothetical protein ACJIZ3_005835 [Penstemon smallii]|uniref:Integrase catalytic domain-containing protein n=1 Tax=Penstemon smallii TaxID=265156 RepID=A0ABD3S600_9LAMI